MSHSALNILLNFVHGDKIRKFYLHWKKRMLNFVAIMRDINALFEIISAITNPVFTCVKVDLLQPKNQSKKLPLTYTWVKNWDKWKIRDKFFV